MLRVSFEDRVITLHGSQLRRYSVDELKQKQIDALYLIGSAFDAYRKRCVANPFDIPDIDDSLNPAEAKAMQVFWSLVWRTKPSKYEAKREHRQRSIGSVRGHHRRYNRLID